MSKSKKYSSVLDTLDKVYCKGNKPKLTVVNAGYIFQHIMVPEWPNKKELRNQLVEGTLYILIDYLKELNLPEIMECASFDYNDFVQNAVLSWIKAIDKCIKERGVINIILDAPYNVVLLNLKEMYDKLTRHTEGLKTDIKCEKFGNLLEMFVYSKDKWDLPDEELSHRIGIPPKEIPKYRMVIENAFAIVNKSFAKESTEESREKARTTYKEVLGDSNLSNACYYQLLYYSSLEYMKERIEKKDSYDGEEKIIDDIAHKEKLDTLRELFGSLSEQEERILKNKNGINEDGVCYGENHIMEDENLKVRAYRKTVKDAYRKIYDRKDLISRINEL